MFYAALNTQKKLSLFGEEKKYLSNLKTQSDILISTISFPKVFISVLVSAEIWAGLTRLSSFCDMFQSKTIFGLVAT